MQWTRVSCCQRHRLMADSGLGSVSCVGYVGNTTSVGTSAWCGPWEREEEMAPRVSLGATGSILGSLIAGIGLMAAPASGATQTDPLINIGIIVWEGLDSSTKARVCHAYYEGGKPAIRRVVFIGKGDSGRIKWSSQKMFQRHAAAKCDQRRRTR